MIPPGLGADRAPFEMQFACDRPPDQGGPPQHKHTGTTYTLKPPKSSLSLKWSMKLAEGEPAKVAQSIHRWMDRAFGPETAALLRLRMYGPDEDDPEATQMALAQFVSGEKMDGPAQAMRAEDFDPDEDPLDLPDIMAVVKYTAERVNGVPPT